MGRYFPVCDNRRIQLYSQVISLFKSFNFYLAQSLHLRSHLRCRASPFVHLLLLRSNLYRKRTSARRLLQLSFFLISYVFPLSKVSSFSSMVWSLGQLPGLQSLKSSQTPFIHSTAIRNFHHCYSKTTF